MNSSKDILYKSLGFKPNEAITFKDLGLYLYSNNYIIFITFLFFDHFY